MIQGFINGILGSIGGIIDAVKNVGSTIASYLHFSRPDVGPLREYETWMPDFMGGLAKGIEKSRSMIQNAVKDVASDMILNPDVSVGADLSTMGNSNESPSQNGPVQNISGPLIQIQEMSVRNDNDIRKISQELNSMMCAGRRARGLV